MLNADDGGITLRAMPSGTRRSVRSYRDLVAWQRAFDLALECYTIARTLPAHERFGLAAQMRRAAVSVTANIAEGNGRMSRGDYVRFLRISHGSLRELETHVMLAERLGYIDSTGAAQVHRLASETGRLLLGLIRSLIPERAGTDKG